MPSSCQTFSGRARWAWSGERGAALRKACADRVSLCVRRARSIEWDCRDVVSAHTLHGARTRSSDSRPCSFRRPREPRGQVQLPSTNAGNVRRGFAPGWYPDPENRTALRWWNGDTWTAHRRTGAHTSLPAAGGEPRFPHVHVEDARLAARRRELEAVEEAIEIQSFGFYRPRYGLPQSEHYTARLQDIRDRQKELIVRSEATLCDGAWRIEGSVVEVRKLIQRLSKLMLRAFNGECDAAIAKTRYDNVLTLEQRIAKSYEQINVLGQCNGIVIAQPYYELKLEELHLVHEHREKLEAEKEEQRHCRLDMREEAKVLEELARARDKADKDEARCRAALAKARTELADSTGKRQEWLQALVARLESELSVALDARARVLARVQLARSGHVYVLSNVGSFGEGVYNIGVTRRLDPRDHVDELADGSVPFGFDVHAFIYAEDAAALQSALYEEFESRRVNRLNPRAAYFRVSLEEIRAAVEKHHGRARFVVAAEAAEWRKTRAMLDADVTG
jgi:uncharacterized protein DUF4041/Meiotically Up-regulated Gene 113 (MUG113) protein/uncharacterized protein DUF2510